MASFPLQAIAYPESSPPQAGMNPNSPLTQGEIDEKPWKYTGYRGFASFMASEADFLVLRRFDELNTRILLSLQDDLAALEEELATLENNCAARGSRDVHNGTRRSDPIPERLKLIATITSKVKEYDEILLNYSQLRGLPTAPSRPRENIETWMFNNPSAIQDREAEFIKKKDLVSLEQRPKSAVREFFETNIAFRAHGLWKGDAPANTPPAEQQARQYVDNDRVERLSTLCIFAVGLAMLIAPLWALEGLHSPYYKLGLITAFIVAFLVIMSAATTSKPLETLGATAAYAAVLMVFLQLGSTSS